jgi:hypothetical protein
MPFTTQQESHRSALNFDHEIMEIGLICSNLIENRHFFSNPVYGVIHFSLHFNFLE